MVNTNNIFAIILVVVLLYASNRSMPTVPTTPDVPSISSNYTSLIDAGISVTGIRMFVPGTSLKDEDVRIIRLDGGGTKTDMGYFSLDRTAIAVTPAVKYKLYYFMNTSPSTIYYPDIRDYIGKEQDAVDNIYGEGCTIDNSPVFWVKDVNGNTQTATANAQALAASGTVDITLFIKAGWESCYGIPDAKDKNKQNTVCLLYNSTPFSNLETNTGHITTPKSIADSGNATNKVINCFQFPVISNVENVEIPLTLTASSTEPTDAHNITVMSEDVCVDINNDNLEEIWGYEDEDYNNLCAPPVDLGKIYIS